MVISHKNTNTIGDFANTWPLLSHLSKTAGPLEITLPGFYSSFNGLKEFLEYQDFCRAVDFNDRPSDLDVQAYTNYDNPVIPTRCYYTAQKLNKTIDRELILNIENQIISPSIYEKIIIIDRAKTNVLKNTNWFNSDKYHWLDFSKPLTYNINICLKAKKIIATFTGLPIILDLFNKQFDLIWFDDINGNIAYKDHYFPERNSKLYYYKDYEAQYIK